MKKIEKLSETIINAAWFNMLATMILVTVFKVGIALLRWDPSLITIGAVMLGYSIVVLLAAIHISWRLNRIVKERRNNSKEETDLEKAS